MDAHVLSARPRTRLGKSGSRASRREGFVPSVVYGGQAKPLAIDVNARQLARLIRDERGAAALVRIEVTGGEPTLALIKEVQREPVTKSLVHCDFLAVLMDQEIHVAVPLHFVGEPAGIDEGGTSNPIRHEIEVACLPGDIPAALEVDVKAVGLNQHLTAGDLTLPAGAKLLTDPTEPVFTVTVAAAPSTELESAGEVEEAAGGNDE